MKPDNHNEFDRQLRQKFENFCPKPSAGLWEKIAAQLDEGAPQQHEPTVIKHRRFPTWWMAVAAVLLVVCGVLYWQSRPVSITYLRADTQAVATVDKVVEEPELPENVAEPTPVTEPLDLERLRRVFAKRDRKGHVQVAPRTVIQEKTRVSEEVRESPQAEVAALRPLVMAVPQIDSLNGNADRQTEVERAEIETARVPDIQPLVVLEEEEETMLATGHHGKQPFGLSNILNYVVGAVDQREEKLVTFSNDDEGSLKLDFNLGLAKNRKKRFK